MHAKSFARHSPQLFNYRRLPSAIQQSLEALPPRFNTLSDSRLALSEGTSAQKRKVRRNRINGAVLCRRGDASVCRAGCLALVGGHLMHVSDDPHEPKAKGECRGEHQGDAAKKGEKSQKLRFSNSQDEGCRGHSRRFEGGVRHGHLEGGNE